MNNNNVQQVRNENDSKKIFTTLVLILTLMICTTSATYAYFALSAVSNNVIAGEAAAAGLTFVNSDGTGESVNPTLIAPTTTTYQAKKMVPQFALNGSTNVLQKAFDGATGKDKCIDANDNAICRAYQVTVKNDSTATVVIKGQIKFSFNGTFTNLKWKLMDSATAVTVAAGNAGTVATTEYVNFVENVSLASGEYKTYNLIFWIEETGSAQNIFDNGSWYATLQFINQVDNSGITSTITS